MFVLDSVAPRAALCPPSDQAAWEALLATVAHRAAQQGADTGWQLPCPACMALVHGVSSSQASHDADLEAVLTARCPIFGHRCRIRHQQAIAARIALIRDLRAAVQALSLAHAARCGAALPPGVFPARLR